MQYKKLQGGPAGRRFPIPDLVRATFCETGASASWLATLQGTRKEGQWKIAPNVGHLLDITIKTRLIVMQTVGALTGARHV